VTIDPTHYRQIFFAEAAEHLASLESVLMQLESDPSNRNSVAEAFRLAHSVKGAADAVGFPDVARFTHRIEEVLGQMREDSQPIAVSRIDALFQAVDHLVILVAAAQSGAPIPEGGDALVAKLGGVTRPPIHPVPPKRAACRCVYRILISPALETFQCGIDPLTLIKDLSQTVEIRTVEMHRDRLPALGELDPEVCFLSWTILLETESSPAELEEVFAFVAHAVAVKILPEPTATPEQAESIASTPRYDPLWFGCFLCQREVISQEQLTVALDHVRRSLPLIGVLAIQEGLLTSEAMTEILAKMEPGERFGEASVRLGALAEADLWQLHLLHQERMPDLGSVLLELGLITAEKLAAEGALFSQMIAGVTEPEPAPNGDAPVESSPAPVQHSTLVVDYELLGENAEMISEFCTEAEDHLLAADRNLLELHADASNKQAVDAIYRGFHTIKGVSSMLGLRAVQGLAHEAENLLNVVRDGNLLLKGRPLDMAFAATDGLKRQFGFIRDWLQHRGLMEQDAILDQLLSDLRTTAAGQTSCISPPLSVVPATQPVVAKPLQVTTVVETVPSPPSAVPAAKAPTNSPNATGPAAAATPAARRPATAEKETVRVDRDRLDKLVNTIGELVIAQSMAEEEVSGLMRQAGGQMKAMAELTKISRALQELGLSLRMVPMSGVFQKMSRLVRDLSRKMDKPVELELHGEETELDKSVVDHLGDPLMHMVRNAIDHGLESVEERVAAGKPATGHVTLNAFHQGGSVFIELSDDGKGLDREKLFKKAVEKGIVTENQRLSDAEVYALIFEAGFSTAKAVTDVSGRGVGMDVVRRNVEELHGSILISTELGKGTTFTIRLPLTLAIMDGLMVALGDDVYLLPMLSVVESIRPKRADLHTMVGRGEVVSARGETIPLLRLHALLGRPVRVTDPCKGLVVLVEDQGKKYALLVDDLLGQMQAVVKSLDSNYHRVEGLTGATILGDGRVAMILDVHGLTKLQGRLGGNWRPSPRTTSEFTELSGAR